jgi:hypothetical protein
MRRVKPARVFLMTYLSVTQLETRHRLVEADLGRADAKAAGRRVARRPRRSRRWFRAVRSAAAA